MLHASELSQGVNDIAHFRLAGLQTQITPELQSIATGIQGNTLEKCRQIVSFIQTLQAKPFDKNLFRKRTASQIVSDKIITGCTDADLVFVVLARASNLSAKYVETIEESWLRGKDKNPGGHQYAQVYDESDTRWVWVNPMDGKVDVPTPQSDNRVIYKIGLDSWDIGITDYDSLEEAFIKFRTQWMESQDV